MKMFTKDILGYIFEFLDPKYLSDISLVCITWNYVLTEAFWSRQIIKYRGIGPDDYKKYFNNDKNYTPSLKKLYFRHKKSIFIYLDPFAKKKENVLSIYEKEWPRFTPFFREKLVDSKYKGGEWVMLTPTNVIYDKGKDSCISLGLLFFLFYKTPGICIENKIINSACYNATIISEK